MELADGITLDVDLAQKRARICVAPSQVDGLPPQAMMLPAFCLPWVPLAPILAELKRAGVNVKAEGGRALKNIAAEAKRVGKRGIKVKKTKKGGKK